MALSKTLIHSTMRKLDKRLNELQNFVFLVDDDLNSYKNNSSILIDNLEATILGSFYIYRFFKRSKVCYLGCINC